VTDRIKSNSDFAYLTDEVARLKERLERDDVSLNKKTREQERIDSEQRKDKYLADRTARAKAIGEAGKNDFKTFLLTLDNVNNPELVPMSAAERAKMSGMKVAEKSADEDSSDDPDEHKYPYGIEPSKLESFHVLQDLAELQHSTSVTAK
jgi:carboxyl-terminal processing protease